MGNTLLTDWVTVSDHKHPFVVEEKILSACLQGIGLEGHEAPYLRGGADDIIVTGHSFSNEPGVYIEGEVRSS
jgi:hypothetical protein